MNEAPSIADSGASWLPRGLASIPPARALTATLVVALVIRVYLSLANFCISGDGIAYLVMARDFAAGDPMAALRQVFSPLYPLIIAGAHLVIPNWELAGDLVSAIIGTAAVVSIFAMTRVAFAPGEALARRDSSRPCRLFGFRPHRGRLHFFYDIRGLARAEDDPHSPIVDCSGRRRRRWTGLPLSHGGYRDAARGRRIYRRPGAPLATM